MNKNLYGNSEIEEEKKRHSKGVQYPILALIARGTFARAVPSHRTALQI
jgi:hypothetical protein